MIWRLIFGRLCTAVLTLFLVSAVIFAIMEVLPGDVVTIEVAFNVK